MEQKEKNMKDFLSAIIMGKEIFKLYEQRAQMRDLRVLFEEAINTFNQHQEKITNLIIDEGFKNDIVLKKSQKMAIKMEKSILNNENDFQICLNAISAMKTAMVKALSFLYDHHYDFTQDFLNASKEVIRDYDNIQLKYKEYAINLIS